MVGAPVDSGGFILAGARAIAFNALGIVKKRPVLHNE
jgi:hypothetical protein